MRRPTDAEMFVLALSTGLPLWRWLWLVARVLLGRGVG